MKQKSNIWDIFKNKNGRWLPNPVMAFLTGTTFSICGILDASIKGVSVDESFYWACVAVIIALMATESLEYIAAIRTGRNSIEQNKNNFDQQVNNLEQNQNNKNSEEP